MSPVGSRAQIKAMLEFSARHRIVPQVEVFPMREVNGVYRRLRKPTALRDGDLVLLGLEVLEFDLVDHAERGLGHAIQHGVLVFGSPVMTATRFAFAVISTLYLAIAIPWEERDLLKTFGGEYEAYRRRVRWRMIPFVY